MKIVNATPHEIILYLGGNDPDYPGMGELRLPPSGLIARAEEQTQPAGEFYYDGEIVPIVACEFGSLTGLPPENEDTAYVVSAIAARAARAAGRTDCYTVALPVRDGAGRIVAARALARM
jgi:hypothetical protein